MAGKPSLMELKRQQWAREREEAKTDWCPWGRPGCGAPLKWHRTSARSESRLTPVESKKNNTNYLPPLNWSTHQNEPQVLQMPATAPPPPPPRRSQRHVSHTDGETSGYHSDNHLIDPAAANYHLRRQLPSSRGRVEPLPPDTASVVIVDNQQDGHNVISARADYKFLERKKWVQDGTVPYDLYPECLPQIYDRSTPPRWVARPMNAAFVQTEPLLSDRTLDDGTNIGGHNGHHAPQHCITNAAPSFLRGQNTVVDAAELVEREKKRAKANELQRVLLQQLAEKENQKQLERKKQEEEERRQEDEFKRHLEAEKRQMEEERRRIQEKKEAEERRLEAVKEAIAGAQQNVLAEKMARRRTMQSRSVPDDDPPTNYVDRATPAQQQPVEHQIAESRQFITPRPQFQSRSCLVDVEVQTDQPHVQIACRCDNTIRSRQSRRTSARFAAGTEESGAERPVTQMSMVALKSQSSNSTTNRPLWGAHKSKAKYQSQTEKDPRFLQRRRERLRRRQKLLLEKQLHGSWPSSENSGSQEEMGGIFFPFLPGSGTAGPHEKYYEALQAAAVSRYYKKPQPSHNVYHHHGKSNGIQSDGELIQPGVIPQPPITPARPQSRHMSSPPVPAVLKKIQRISKGSDSQGEKHEWENYDSTDHDAKIDKNFENLQIKERRPCTEQDKQELLARLSYLKLRLEEKKTALDLVSLASSQ